MHLKEHLVFRQMNTEEIDESKECYKSRTEKKEMKTWIRNGILLTPFRKIYGGSCIVENGKIIQILESGELPHPEPMDLIDAKGQYIAPGFIDVHVHGGGGTEVMGADTDDIVKMCSAHSRYGTTSILPTTLAAPVPQLCEAIEAVKNAVDKCKECNILGVHLEGPFLSAKQCGAQNPEYVYSADEDNLKTLLGQWDGIRMVGAAPEIPNGYWLGRELEKRGITVSVAHSDATFEETLQALEYGYEDITHIYSACSSVYRKNAYRIAGVVEAGLYEDLYSVQVIADGKHLPVSLLKLIYKCKGADRIVLITDGLAMSACDVKEGDIYIQRNGIQTIMQDGVMKLMHGQSFAGSIATMSQLVHNMVHLAGVPIEEAVRMAAYNPAKLIRCHKQKGMLAKDMDADIILFDENIDVSLTMTGGRVVYQK